jgi:hypothetical protein
MGLALLGSSPLLKSLKLGIVTLKLAEPQPLRLTAESKTKETLLSANAIPSYSWFSPNTSTLTEQELQEYRWIIVYNYEHLKISSKKKESKEEKAKKEEEEPCQRGAEHWILLGRIKAPSPEDVSLKRRSTRSGGAIVQMVFNINDFPRYVIANTPSLRDAEVKSGLSLELRDTPLIRLLPGAAAATVPASSMYEVTAGAPLLRETGGIEAGFKWPSITLGKVALSSEPCSTLSDDPDQIAFCTEVAERVREYESRCLGNQSLVLTLEKEAKRRAEGSKQSYAARCDYNTTLKDRLHQGRMEQDGLNSLDGYILDEKDAYWLDSYNYSNFYLAERLQRDLDRLAATPTGGIADYRPVMRSLHWTVWGSRFHPRISSLPPSTPDIDAMIFTFSEALNLKDKDAFQKWWKYAWDSSTTAEPKL